MAGIEDVPQTGETIVEVLEETASVRVEGQRAVRVRIVVGCETVPTPMDVELQSERVDIEHVPIGRMLERDEVPPQTRDEDGTLVVPILEERVVVERRLVLVEEVRVTRIASKETRSLSIPLRRQTVTVERTEDQPDRARTTQDR